MIVGNSYLAAARRSTMHHARRLATIHLVSPFVRRRFAAASSPIYTRQTQERPQDFG